MKTKEKKNSSEVDRFVEDNDRLLAIVAMDSIATVNAATDQVFPCMSDEEARAALIRLNCSHVEVEVAGGIVRHHHRW